jgi:outer membrane immunogenic protein
MNTERFTSVVPLALLVAGLLASAAAAEDVFSGPHLSAGLSRSTLAVDQNVRGVAGRFDKTESALGYRAAAGYDLQFDSFVVGGEIGARHGRSEVAGSLGGSSVEHKPGFSWDYSARAGVVLGERLLAYGRVGGARGDVKEIVRPEGAATVRRTVESNGWLYGGGLEYAVSDGFAIRGEYGVARGKADTQRRDLSVSAVLRF